MLDYRLIDYKATLTKDGNTYIDLLSKVWQNKTPSTGKVIVVNEFYVARPDLISLALYGSDEYADVLCKLNGISNPFELNENMMVFCPTADYLTKLIKPGSPHSALINKNASTAKGTNSNGTSENTINNSLTNKNESTISKEQTNLQKLKSDRRTPGDQTVDENNYIIDKTLGIVIY